MNKKTYTIQIGEIFTEEKAEELREYLELKDKDVYQAEQEMLKKVIDIIKMTDTPPNWEALKKIEAILSSLEKEITN